MVVAETGPESQDVDAEEEGGDQSCQEGCQPHTEPGPDTPPGQCLVASGEIPHCGGHHACRHQDPAQDVHTEHHPHPYQLSRSEQRVLEIWGGAGTEREK